VVRIVRDLALETADAEAAPSVLPASEWKAWAWGPYRSPGLDPAIPVLHAPAQAAEADGQLPACVGFSR